MASIRRDAELMEAALANMIARQDKVTDFNEGSVAHTILDTAARLAERAYIAIRQGYNEMLKVMPYSIFGMEKKAGVKASGTVVFSREKALNAASAIPKGTKVSGNGLVFETTETGTIQAGETESAPVAASPEEAGSGYNIGAGVIESIDTAVPADVVSVSNPYAFSGGTDEETDAEFEARFALFMNSLSGTNAAAVKNAALSVNAVRSVSVLDHKPPEDDIYNLSVYVDDGSGSASAGIVEAVRLAIEGDGTDENPGHLAPGVNMQVLAPAPVPVNVKITVTVASASANTAAAEIEAAILEYINALTIGESCLVAEIISRVMALSYVKDIAVSLPAANVPISGSQIARSGDIDISLLEE